MLITIKILERKPLKSGMMYEENGERLFLIGLLRMTLVRISMKIQTPGTGGLARSISCHETGLPEKPPLQATRKGGKWRVVHHKRCSCHLQVKIRHDGAELENLSMKKERNFPFRSFFVSAIHLKDSFFLKRSAFSATSRLMLTITCTALFIFCTEMNSYLPWKFSPPV